MKVGGEWRPFDVEDKRTQRLRHWMGWCCGFEGWIMAGLGQRQYHKPKLKSSGHEGK